MAKWAGVIGYAIASERSPGVYDYVIHERQHVGDWVRNIRRTWEEGRIVEDQRLNNSISIVADPYTMEHFFEIRYLTISGTRWIVSTIEVNAPRLVLQVGGVYNGPTP